MNNDENTTIALQVPGTEAVGDPTPEAGSGRASLTVNYSVFLGPALPAPDADESVESYMIPLGSSIVAPGMSISVPVGLSIAR